MSTYKVQFNDGSRTESEVVITRGSVDTESVDITLFGRNKFEYGEGLNENLVHLLEHFASEEERGDIESATTNIERREIVASIEPGTTNWAIKQPTVGQLWANKTSQHLHVFNHLLNKWDVIQRAGDIVTNWGTIADGGTIPLPIGADGQEIPQDQCSWIVAPNTWGSDTGYVSCKTNDSRVVTIKTGATSGSATGSTANYLIIGIVDNVNTGSNSDPTVTTETGGLTVQLSSTAIGVSGSVNTTISGTVTVSTIETPTGALTYSWSRLSESGCDFVTQTSPVDTGSGMFVFSSTGTEPTSCSSIWRVVVTDEDGNTGSAELVLLFQFAAVENQLTVSSTAFATGTAQANETATISLAATIAGGVAPYTIEWANEAIDGSGATKTSQTPAVIPPSALTSSSATYTLQRGSAQTVFTRTKIVVTDAEGTSATSFSTMKYNFLESSTSIETPALDDLTMVIEGTTSGVYTIEDSAYTAASPGADSNVHTLSIPVQISGTTTNGTLYISRLRDTDQVQFGLTSPSIFSGALSGTFTFSINATSAANYPGTNTDAWRITFQAADGRTIYRDVITKFNYLVSAVPLSVVVGDVTITSTAQNRSNPLPTYVTLSARVAGGTQPYSYVWNISNINGDYPFQVIGPINGPSLTLMLRGTTFNHQQGNEIVWPSLIPGEVPFAYEVTVPVTVRDSSLPTEEQQALGTAAIAFTVDDSNMAVSASYSYTVPSAPPPVSPYTMTGCWLCNSDYLLAASPYNYTTFSRLTLNVVGGSGEYDFDWVEESAEGTLTGAIVFTNASEFDENVYFAVQQTDCVSGSRYYEGVWRCDITDVHTGKVITHRETVRIDVCRATPGTVSQQIQKVICGAGFTCG